MAQRDDEVVVEPSVLRWWTLWIQPYSLVGNGKTKSLLLNTQNTRILVITEGIFSVTNFFAAMRIFFGFLEN